MKSNKIFLFVFLILLVNFNFVSAGTYEENYSVVYDADINSQINIKQLRYEPYPATPGEYFDLWIKVENTGSTSSEDLMIELVPEFPFSLDSNEDSLRSFGLTGKTQLVVKYKVRVDEDAVEGINELKVKYRENSYSFWKEQIFNIDIAESGTDFDAVIQESSTSEVSIAIANIGKNTANSVVVKIPEQEDFRATGTDGQMVGNLENGDYTIIGFSLMSTAMNKNEESVLKFDIYYTDSIGERRVKNMEIPLNVMGSSDVPSEDFFEGRNFRRKSSWSIWYTLLIILVIIIAFFVLKKKYPEKTKKFMNKLGKVIRGLSKKNKINNKEIPAWIKNEKEKKK